ncbi:retrovirus-related pol polyprotein from transposon TNT 1-94 [Tanacetum coccineum]
MENETNLRVKCLTSNNGGEYSSREFIEYCAENEIRMLKTVPETPQQNGVAERMNRTLNERVKRFRIPAEEWQGKEAMDQMRWDITFGMKGHKVVRSRDVTFNEDSLYGAKAAIDSSNLTKPNQKGQVSPGGSLDMSEGFENNRSFEDSGRSDKEDYEDEASSEVGGSETPQVRRSNRESMASVRVQEMCYGQMKDLGSTKKILGMSIIRDKTKGTPRISQEKYIGKVLEKFIMKDAETRCQPLGEQFKLSKKQVPKMEASRKRMAKVPYASAVGSVSKARYSSCSGSC